MGKNRASGSGGNLWDIQTAYNADGVHFNQAGHGQVALALANAIGSGTTIALTSSASMSPFGKSVTFTATVSPVAPGADTPTGTVTFKNGSTTLESVPLSGGTAAYSTTALTGGSHAITAVYDGDTNYTTSTSTDLALTISGSAAANQARQEWWKEYEQYLMQQSASSAPSVSQSSSSSVSSQPASASLVSSSSVASLSRAALRKQLQSTTAATSSQGSPVLTKAKSTARIKLMLDRVALRRLKRQQLIR